MIKRKNNHNHNNNNQNNNNHNKNHNNHNNSKNIILIIIVIIRIILIILIIRIRGGFRGGGGGGAVPPLISFQKSIFGRPTLKFFLRRLWRQYILTLRGSARQKKTRCFVKIFQKVPKNGFLDCFFKNLPAAQKILPK